MKIKLLFIGLTVVLVSCGRKKSVNKTETKYFGDTLKIEYTYKGDTTYQKRTDLKSKKKILEITSVWKTLNASNLDCKEKIRISKDNINYSFCFDVVYDLTVKQMKNKTELKWSKDEIYAFYRELLEIQNKELKTISSSNYYMIYYFLRNGNFSIYDNFSETSVTKIRLENYKTNHSKGNIYYLINSENDTISSYNLNNMYR